MSSVPYYLDAMEAGMREDSRDMLRRIWEPTVVGAPLADARRDVCILPDGEIRCYGYLYGKVAHSGDGQAAYLSSTDGGLSWTRHYAYGKMGSCTYVEEAQIYLTSWDRDGGLWVKRSAIGPDDPAPEMIKVADGRFGDAFLPQKSAYGNRVWFTAQRNDRSDPRNPKSPPVFVYSDDFGLTWTLVELPSTPPFEIKPPHKGLRWCKGSGSEPYAIELSRGEMMMMIRTPHDCFYISRSYDGGSSWSTPEPSTFYGTNTTPFLLRLSDGRVIAFWNNTRPLPQPDYATLLPSVGRSVLEGRGECAFTNRDAAHAAISDDGGKSFMGYREILLNPIRGNTDFRYIGGISRSLDKSVHQFQAYELPYGKILVCLGQNLSARLVIFDAGWLLETERYEDFVHNALERITTHTYLKSFSDHTANDSGNGHCAWNRAPSAYPMPDPEGSRDEVLSISKRHDPRLYSEIGGATWNFPASKRGRVTVTLKLVEQTARLILTDRWYNTCDAYAASQSPFVFELSTEQLGRGYVELMLDYNTERGCALA